MAAFEDLSLLHAFVCIVECGSISAGARRLKVSQPTLSRQLRALEEHCGAALLRRDTHAMCVTPIGQRLLADARTMLRHAEEAEERLHEEQMELGGHLRLFATIDWGTWVVTPMLSSFMQLHPKVTAELALANRPLHMLREGCDVGILPGKITDESVVARPAGMIVLHLAAAPSLVKKHRAPKALAGLKSWPWLSLSGTQFWSSKEVTLVGRDGVEESLPIAPILFSEGVTSVREATRAGLGVAILPDWLVDEDVRAKRLVRLLPQWRMTLPLHVVYAGQRPFAGPRERLHRLCRCLHVEEIGGLRVKSLIANPVVEGSSCAERSLLE